MILKCTLSWRDIWTHFLLNFTVFLFTFFFFKYAMIISPLFFLAEHERMVEAYNLMNQKLQQSVYEHANFESSTRELKVYYDLMCHHNSFDFYCCFHSLCCYSGWLEEAWTRLWSCTERDSWPAKAGKRICINAHHVFRGYPFLASL